MVILVVYIFETSESYKNNLEIRKKIQFLDNIWGMSKYFCFDKAFGIFYPILKRREFQCFSYFWKGIYHGTKWTSWMQGAPFWRLKEAWKELLWPKITFIGAILPSFWKREIYQGTFCHVNLETNTGKFGFLQCKVIN